MAATQKITHLIVELNTGGAEMSLLRLLQGTADRLQHRVICLGEPTPLGEQIRSLGVPVLWLPYRRGGRLSPVLFWRALRQARFAVRAAPPDILQGWMYYGNLLASWCGLDTLTKVDTPVKVAWNIRHSLVADSPEKLQIRLALQLSRWSRLQPDLLIYNARSGQRSHAHLGFRAGREQVIVNGIDIAVFSLQPRPLAQPAQIGMIGRFHPHKGVPTYLSVVRQLRDAHPGRCEFCMAGAGLEADNDALAALLQQAGLGADDVRLLGPQDNIAALLAQLDVVLLTSEQEATPNVLLEAMACGATPVATRVGDVAHILEDEARLVAPGDAAAMVDKVVALLAMDSNARQQLQQRDRHVIEEGYNLARCMQTYLDAYQGLSA